MYLAKTFQPSPSVLFLSTLGPRSGVNLHLTPFLCPNQVDSALEEAQAGVSAPGAGGGKHNPNLPLALAADFHASNV